MWDPLPRVASTLTRLIYFTHATSPGALLNWVKDQNPLTHCQISFPSHRPGLPGAFQDARVVAGKYKPPPSPTPCHLTPIKK